MRNRSPDYEYDFNRQKQAKPMRNELYWRFKKQRALSQDHRNGPVTVKRVIQPYVPQHVRDIMREEV